MLGTDIRRSQRKCPLFPSELSKTSIRVRILNGVSTTSWPIRWFYYAIEIDLPQFPVLDYIS